MTKEVIAIAWNNSGLYKLTETSFNSRRLHKAIICLASYSNNEEICIWHKRLGHVSNKALSHIESIEASCMNNDCIVCILAKQR